MKMWYEHLKHPNTEHGAACWIRRGLLAWLLAVTLECILQPVKLNNLRTLCSLSQLRVAVVTVALLILWYVISCFFSSSKAERWLLAAAFGTLATVSLVRDFTLPLLGASIFVLTVFCFYALRGWRHDREPGPNREPGGIFGVIAALAAVAFFLFVSIWTVCRIYSFSTPTYDFGIFSQMFHSMRTTGLPMTTLERDGPLSHFAVHVSPIYYLLLPFYALVPKPATLQVMQAAVLASAVIPLWKLGALHGLKPWQRCGFCLILLVYPAYAGGTSYDIHENAFLTPLILWLFYGLRRQNGWLTALFALLTLLVKEDAAVYVAVIALWLLLKGLLQKPRGWDFWTGLLLLVGAVAYFMAVTGYLSSRGDGVMTYRYDNLIFDGSDSLVSVIKTVLICPMKAVYECMDTEKLPFIGLTLLPLAGLPLLTRRYERYVLLIPYVLVNLMSDYRYQHDIFFQYTYGSTACLLYLAMMNLTELTQSVKKLLLAAALGIGICCSAAQVVPKAASYLQTCITYDAYYDSFRQTLELVPDGASVASSTYYTTMLSNREELYDVRYASRAHILSCDYVVLGVRDSYSYKPYAKDGMQGLDALVEILEEAGYTLYTQLEGRLLIYQSKNIP